VLNVSVPLEDKSNDTKDNFYEELDCVWDQSPTYHIEITRAV